MERFAADKIFEDRFLLGEAPFYDERYWRLSWVDIIRGSLNLWYPMTGERKCIETDERLGAAVPLAGSDGFLLAQQTGLYVFENGNRSLYLSADGHYEKWQRSNDAKADPEGRLWFGSVSDDDEHSGGNLYCLMDGKAVVKEPDTGIANGMAWSRDKKRFFFSDSLEHGVFVYDYDAQTAEIKERRKLFEITDGVPDGMCIDDNDDLWVAVWGGSRVECRSSEDGRLLSVIDIPAKNVTSCCFGENGKLFITSSGQGLSGSSDGCLFSCNIKVTAPPMVPVKL